MTTSANMPNLCAAVIMRGDKLLSHVDRRGPTAMPMAISHDTGDYVSQLIEIGKHDVALEQPNILDMNVEEGPRDIRTAGDRSAACHPLCSHQVSLCYTYATASRRILAPQSGWAYRTAGGRPG